MGKYTTGWGYVVAVVLGAMVWISVDSAFGISAWVQGMASGSNGGE